MPFISITRLKIRSIRFLPAFGLHAIRTRDQVRRAAGFEGGALLPDRAWTFWTMTAWTDEASMRRYVMEGPHRLAMPRLVHWCDEASVVHWQRDEAGLPDWDEADRRMRETGRPSKVRNPSPRHATLSYRPPRLSGSGPITPASRASREPARH